MTLLTDPDDMRWLRDVHLPGLPAKYKSAVLHGNEDCPDRIDVYIRRCPLLYIGMPAASYVYTESGYRDMQPEPGSLFDPEVPFDNPAVFKPAQGLCACEDNPPPRLVDVSMLAAKYGGTITWAPLWPGGRLIQFKDEVRASQFLKAAQKWRSESGVAYITAHRIMQSPTTGKWLVFASVEEPPLIEPGSLFDLSVP